MWPRSRNFARRRWRNSGANRAGNEHGYVDKEIGKTQNQVGGQLHRLPEGHAGDHPRSGVSPNAASGGARRYTGRPGDDPEGPASGCRDGVGKLRLKSKVENRGTHGSESFQFEAGTGIAAPQGARGPRDGLEARQDGWQRQQRTEIAQGLLTPSGV